MLSVETVKLTEQTRTVAKENGLKVQVRIGKKGTGSLGKPGQRTHAAN